MTEAPFTDWERLERTPLADTSDGSTCWFDMRHEEGLAVDRGGHIIQHAVAGEDESRLVFSAAAILAAADGGVLLHSHPQPGTSFSVADLAALTLRPDGRGIALAVTTSHPLNGTMRQVRYIMDMREREGPCAMPPFEQIERLWDDAFARVGVDLYAEDSGSLGVEEGYALYLHRVMERISRRLGVAYRREVVK